MLTNLAPTLFAGANAATHFYISYDDFERQLYYDLLFQPSGLGMSDANFLTNYVYQHVTHRGGLESPLFLALDRKHLVPFFRNPSCPDFLSEADALVKQGIHSLSPYHKWLAEQFTRARYAPRFWPEGSLVGERFEKTLCTVMGNDELPSYFFSDLGSAELSGLADFWTRRAFWRHEVLASAKRLTEERTGVGIRVTEIDDQLARTFGIAEAVDGPIDLFKQIRRLNDDTLEKDLAIFYKIVLDIYNSNLAQGFRPA